MFRNLSLRIRFSIFFFHPAFIDRLMHSHRHYSHASHFSSTTQLSNDLCDTTECSANDWHLIPLPYHGRSHPVSSSTQRYNSVPFSAYRFWWVFESLRAHRHRPFDWRLANAAEVDRKPRSNYAFDCVLVRLLCADGHAISLSEFSTNFSVASTFFLSPTFHMWLTPVWFHHLHLTKRFVSIRSIDKN